MYFIIYYDIQPNIVTTPEGNVATFETLKDAVEYGRKEFEPNTWEPKLWKQ